MARRKAGDGLIRKRKDGRWEGRVVVGYDGKGFPKTKNVLAKTKRECVEKLNALKAQLAPAQTDKLAADMPLGDQYGAGLSDRSVRLCHVHCRTALQKSVEQGLLRSNPAEGCKLPPKSRGATQVLTREEMQRFLNQGRYEGYYELFLLELATGLRRRKRRASSPTRATSTALRRICLRLTSRRTRRSSTRRRRTPVRWRFPAPARSRCI